jgi:hypothetical protein
VQQLPDDIVVLLRPIPARPQLPAGGIRALGAEAAEDAASAKIVRAAGLRVRLVDEPFQQPLGRRSLKEVWWREHGRSTFVTCGGSTRRFGSYPQSSRINWTFCVPTISNQEKWRTGLT